MSDPVSLPDIAGWEEVEFDPVAVRDTERMEGRRTETVREATTWWKARYVPGFLSLRDYGKMDAFMMAVDGDGECFRAYDPFRPRPLAHDNGQPLTGTRAAGGAFDGTATLFDIIDSRTIEVSGLPEGFTLQRGDYVEIRKTALTVSLHRIQADVTAGPSGHAVLPIRYGLDTGVFTTAATVNFEKPACIMQIDPGSYSGVKARRQRRPSFTAQEVMIREP